MSQREVISFHIGHAGIKIGSKFWSSAQSEHDIDQFGVSHSESDLPLCYSGIYFHESEKGRFIPRSLFIDLDPGTNDCIQCEPISNSMRPENLISGYTSAQNIFARGFFNDGNEILPIIEDAIFREIEKCDSLQGFNFFCGLGGGCGSGLGALLISYIRDVARTKLLHTIPVIPSPKVSSIVVEPYNTVLALNQMSGDTDISICIDNEALLKICQESLKISDPTINDLNYLVTLSILGLTSSMRFPGQLNGDLNKINTLLVPYPRLQFAICSFAPLSSLDTWTFRSYTPRDLLIQNYSPSNWMAACPVEKGLFMSSMALYRGLASTYDVESSVKDIMEKGEIKNTSWLPDNTSLSFCDIPQKGYSSSCTVLANNTAVQYLFKRLWEQYSVMFHRQSFLHWYYGEGLEPEDFFNAEQNIKCLIKEYAKYEVDIDLNEIQKKFEEEINTFSLKETDIDKSGTQNISKKDFSTPTNSKSKALNVNAQNFATYEEQEREDQSSRMSSNQNKGFHFRKENHKPNSSSAQRVRNKRIKDNQSEQKALINTEFSKL